MENLNLRAMNFVLDAAAQSTVTCCHEEALFLIALLLKQEQKRQLDAACLESIKGMLADYEAALLVQETLPALMP
ncbi:hypothetical protein ACN08P_11280 [Photobacterium leiognathi subsp. mandapamensis]|uniref:hypothetical protein n=1 Tax=Photobacterium leiognathi TaxID=553611 RepID=UPI002981B097|nr:hypothetical protein [Photobacterium leiognathi]